MSDPLRDTAPGESPARLLNASTFNLTMAAARWVREHGLAAAGRRGATPATDGTNDARLEVRVRAAGTLPQWAIVTLGDPAIDPGAAPQNANNTPVFECAAPVAGDVVAVLMQPLTAGRIGRAVVQGVCVAPVLIEDPGHRFAVPVAGDVFALLSADSGPIRLLTNPGLGTANCLVCLAPAPPPQNWLIPVRSVATANVNLSAPGASVDSITMRPRDRFLAPFQTDDRQNGVYVWNGASVAATRDPDAEEARYLAGAAVVAQLGAVYGGSLWKCHLTPAATVGADSITWYCALDMPTQGVSGGSGFARSRRLMFADGDFTLSSPGNGGTLVTANGLTVAQSDGSPSYAGIRELRVSVASGFSLSSPGTGIAQIALASAGTVTSVSGGTPADGVTVSVASGTTTPVVTVTLGDITPDSVTTGAVSGTTGAFAGALSADSFDGLMDGGAW